MLGVVLRCHRRSKSTGTHSQYYASWFVVHRSRRVARRCNRTHRNLFSRLHWPRGRSIIGRVCYGMVGSIIKDLFGTSMIWFCHHVHVRQRCWIVRANRKNGLTNLRMHTNKDFIFGYLFDSHVRINVGSPIYN